MRGPNVDYYNSGLSKTKQNHFCGKKKCFMKFLVHINGKQQEIHLHEL